MTQSPVQIEPDIHPLEAADTSAVEALLEAFAALEAALPTELRGDWSPDLAAPYVSEVRPLVRACDALAGAIVHRAARNDRAPLDVDFGRQEQAVRDETASIARDLETSVARLLRNGGRERAIGQVAGRIREVGLEELDIDILLGTSNDTGRLVLIHTPVATSAAHVYLLDRLYQRLEVPAYMDTMLDLERMASAWYFERYSAPETGRRAAELDFAHSVREQEWSLVERPMVSLDLPMLSALLMADEDEGIFPTRQRGLAKSLTRSIAGVFRIERLQGQVAMFRDAETGRRYVVHEHSSETHYRPGFGGLGRLIPYHDGAWLRSPGMVLLDPPRPDLLTDLARGLRETEGLPPEILLEGMITVLVGGFEKIPRRVRPADSPAGARARLEDLRHELEAIGLARQVTEEELPPEIREQLAAGSGSPDLPLHGLDVDDVLAEWMKALMAMARPKATPAAGSAAKKKQKKKAKRRRR